MATTIDPARLRHGQVRGRYFRENFVQAGIDLLQIVPELVTNVWGSSHLMIALFAPRTR